jgi:hypothetical protein
LLRGLLITLIMEEASASETSVNFYQTTRRSNPKESHFHTRRHENLNVINKEQITDLNEWDGRTGCTNNENKKLTQNFVCRT